MFPVLTIDSTANTAQLKGSGINSSFATFRSTNKYYRAPEETRIIWS